MAIYSGLFNSVNGDRKYNAWWFAKYFSTFIGNGIFPNPSTNLQVIENENMKVTVKPGTGWIDGYFIYSDNDYILEHDIADGVLKRVDRIVMRLDFMKRKIDIVIKKGTFASTPTAPTLQRDADAYELALADVMINNGATQITQANITDQRLNSSLCGIVHGTVDQVDTTTLFNQYQSWLNQQQLIYEDSFLAWSNQKELDFDNWQITEKNNFDDWFLTIQDVLDGNVAANLQNQINTVIRDVNNLGIQVSQNTTDIAENEQSIFGVGQNLSTHVADDVSHVRYGIATGINPKAITLSPAPTALVDGLAVSFKNVTTNTGAVTLNINGLGAKSVRNSKGEPLESEDLVANSIYTARYNGTSFILQGEGGGKTELSGEVVGNFKVSDNVSKFDRVVGEDGVHDIKLPDIETFTPTVNGDAFSSDGKYYAVALSSTPFLIVYKVVGDTFIKLPNIAGIGSVSLANDVAFSPDGRFLIVATHSAPRLLVIKCSGDAFTLTSIGDTLVSSPAQKLSFSPTGDCLAISTTSSPYVYFYKVDGDNFTMINTNGGSLPSYNGLGVTFDKTGNVAVLTISSTRHLYAYRRNGNYFTMLPVSAIDIVPNRASKMVGFSVDNKYLAVGSHSSPYLVLYKFDGDSFVKIPTPEVPLTGSVNSLAFNPRTNVLTVGSQGTPFVVSYKIEGELFVKLPIINYSDLLIGNTVNYSPNGVIFVASSGKTHRLLTYKENTENVKKAVGTTIGGFAWYGYAKEKGSAGQTIKIAKLWEV